MTTPPPALTSPRLQLEGVRHAFFTRHGGVSTGIYSSLNLGPGSKDDPEAVAENRRRAAAVFEVGPDNLLSCYQTHSVIARVADAPWAGQRPEGDAIVTSTPGLVCGALSADCAPILFADAEARIVASAHAGWKGALDGVVGSAVSAMVALGASVSRINAVVGPCIGPKSYEVGPEFVDRFVHHDPGSARFFGPVEGSDRQLFDLPSFVLWRLEQAGVEHAEWIGHDTCAEEELFFSNRRAFKRNEGDYGRLMSAIALV
ncbi:peptidoglycan editing factor PgeF [Caulobacter sp. 17J80-11]|uniref:peptidoglycan editing factor PgeF n=1 Tax=Caulobacter sp. 17J80-11 TaxID=2763502 RepID=UPI0016535FCA|nr:peptidoglycan editing factor PgeF [Caulobacter sp. 17J80-11]MBC6982234.1 peptidoglycan editing factor PgeF [Caulobacter sp. 17J80-11]